MIAFGIGSSDSQLAHQGPSRHDAGNAATKAFSNTLALTGSLTCVSTTQMLMISTLGISLEGAKPLFLFSKIKKAATRDREP